MTINRMPQLHRQMIYPLRTGFVNLDTRASPCVARVTDSQLQLLYYPVTDGMNPPY